MADPLVYTEMTQVRSLVGSLVNLKKEKKNEDIEIAEEHIKMAQEIVIEQSRKSNKPEKEFMEAELALEKAESEISDLKEED